MGKNYAKQEMGSYKNHSTSKYAPARKSGNQETY